MAIEIERKFLVRSDGWKAAVVDSQRLVQGYLAESPRASVRIRLLGEDGAVLTLKSAERGIARAEYEYPIPLADARELLSLAGGNLVEKQRHRVRVGDRIWEVDVFEGRHRGLVLAELELEDANEDISLPDWLGEEVTDDPRYANAALARAGLPA